MRITQLLSGAWLVVLLCLCTPCGGVELEYSNRENTLEWFEGARLGVFIHWDARSNCEGARRNGEMDVDIRPFSKRMQEAAMWGVEGVDPKPWQGWNPSRFDADEWVGLIAESGAFQVYAPRLTSRPAVPGS